IIITQITQQRYQADLLAVNIREQWQPWMDVNMPNDGAILVHPLSNLSQAWQDPPRFGLVNGVHFSWQFLEPSMLQSTPHSLFEQGIAYFAMSDKDQRGLFNTPALQQFANQFTLVKVIPALVG